MGNASHGCCGQHFNILIHAIFSCIHAKHLQGHVNAGLQQERGFFLDFDNVRKLMEEDFLGDVELREIPILPFLLLSSEERIVGANHPHTIISQLVGLDRLLVHHRLCSEAPKLSRLLPDV